MALRIFKLDDFEIEKPQQSGVQDVEPFRFFEGEKRTLKFDGNPGYFFLFEGEIEINLGQRSLYVVGGEAIYYEGNDTLEILFVHETTRGVRVEEKSNQPKLGAINPSQTVKIPSSKRLAQLISIRTDQTFSPNMMRGDLGDLAISADIASLGPNVTKEIRENCDENLQTIAFLFSVMPPGRIENYLDEVFVRANFKTLRPTNFCIRMSLHSPFDRERIQKIQRCWLNTMVCLNIVICFEIEYENWSQGDFDIMLETLSTLPPSHWGIVLNLTKMSNTPQFDSFINRVVMLLPWLRGLICEEKQALQLMKVITRHGFQGWMISKE